MALAGKGLIVGNVRPFITGRKFIQLLAEAGIVGPVETIKKVTIWADVTEVVTIDVEHVADERLLGIEKAILNAELNAEAAEEESE